MHKCILMILFAVTPLNALADVNTKLLRTGETVSIPFKMTLHDTEAAIIDGCARAGWIPKRINDGIIEAKLHVRDHIATVHVVFSSESFRVDYADSTNLLATSSPTSRIQTAQSMSTSVANINSTFKKDSADEERIHKNYYVWTDNLQSSIVQSLASNKQSSSSSNSIAAQNTVPQKLRELESLRKEGVLTPEEYQKKKQQLLDQF